MNLIKHNLKWALDLRRRRTTDMIVVHHTASGKDITVEDIHQMHLDRNWAGCGYNIIIYPDGSAHEGRPLDCGGAHCEGYNGRSVGVNLVGNFELYPPTNEQIATLQQVLRWLMDKYNLTPESVGGHEDWNNTACPGKHLNVEEVVASL